MALPSYHDGGDDDDDDGSLLRFDGSYLSWWWALYVIPILWWRVLSIMVIHPIYLSIYISHHHDGSDLWRKNGSFQSHWCFLSMTMVGLICMMMIMIMTLIHTFSTLDPSHGRPLGFSVMVYFFILLHWCDNLGLFSSGIAYSRRNHDTI